jgi:hypothetical protein
MTNAKLTIQKVTWPRSSLRRERAVLGRCPVGIPELVGEAAVLVDLFGVADGAVEVADAAEEGDGGGGDSDGDVRGDGAVAGEVAVELQGEIAGVEVVVGGDLVDDGLGVGGASVPAVGEHHGSGRFVGSGAGGIRALEPGGRGEHEQRSGHQEKEPERQLDDCR